MPTSAIRRKLENLGPTPLTRRDAYNILINPFVERYHFVIGCAQGEIGVQGDSSSGMSDAEIERGGGWSQVFGNWMQGFDQQPCSAEISYLPWPGEDGSACQAYVAPLCQYFMRYGVGTVHSLESLLPEWRTNGFIEMVKDDVHRAESNGLDSLPYENSEGYEESNILDLDGITHYARVSDDDDTP
ncbi:hypothetical protein BYT27DRAFT_7251596 [Phlegmacium glaucopus]|nr:hypothetical protein BYT27DRAFT_7251596 [Phlegmacium glaucopus]